MFVPLFFSCILTAIVGDELISVVVLHRHGDRNPFTTYKTDPYGDESHWPEGLGQLTKRGIQRQYALGKWLNARYSSLLPPRYSPRALRVVSTDVDRTLMSAEVTLAGLYPPSETQKFNMDINWHPIPIHTTPPHKDPFLAMKKPCKKYKKMFDELLSSDHVKEINDISGNLYEFLGNKTGENITGIYDVEVIYNALHSQFLAGKPLPDWALEVYPEEMKPAVLLRYKIPCYNKELARLKTGLWFSGVLENFSHVDHKLLVFSAHDSTVSDVLTTMGAFNDEVPPYSSAVLFELKQNSTDSYINLFFKNDTGLHEVVLDTCTFNCSLTEFKRILGPILVENEQAWDAECGNVPA